MKQIDPVNAWMHKTGTELLLDLGVTNKRGSDDEFGMNSCVPVTITAADWLDKVSYINQHDSSKYTSYACWFYANNKKWFGNYWRGIFDGMDLDTGQQIVLPKTSKLITHVKPIITPNNPGELDN